MPPEVPALTYNPTGSTQHGGVVTSVLSAPVQKAVPASTAAAVAAAAAANGAEDVQAVKKKKVVKKVVKRVKPVALTPS